MRREFRKRRMRKTFCLSSWDNSGKEAQSKREASCLSFREEGKGFFEKKRERGERADSLRGHRGPPPITSEGLRKDISLTKKRGRRDTHKGKKKGG